MNDWFAAQGRAQVLEAPGRAAGLMLRKAGLLLHPEEIAHNKEVAVERSASPLLGWLPMPFAALLGAVLWGLGGLVAAGRVGRIRSNADRGMRRLLEVHGLWIVGSALSLLPFFAASRYRTPLIPSLLVVVAVGAWYWFARIDNRRVAYGALAVSLALGFGIGALLRPLYAGPFPHRWHLDRAMAAADLGRLDEARAELDQALEAAPLDPAVRNEAAKLALRASRWEDARLGFEAVIAADPRNGGALFNLGWLAQREGRAAAALEYYRRAFAAAPDLNQARLGHAQLVRQLATDPDPRRRDGAAALKAMQAWLGDAVPRAEEWELLGACQAEVGDFAAALESVRRAGEAAGPQAGDSALLRRLESERARYAEQKPLRLAPIQ
ncbi:MAG: tetratricopeptide repeat protein [Planctomycetota bacterium]